VKKFEKKKILSEIVSKQSDIIYKKVFIFTVIAGGSWLYGVKIDGYLGYIIWFVFLLSSIGIVFNLSNMGILYRELEEIKNA
jgi:hypothetical protein